MGLSRLENFLRSVRGNIIYVDPNALDSTDSIENTGSALTRPFKTIQRALIEAARFSYLPGTNNDRFGNTTIVVYPGDHVIDNRPGWIPLSGSSFQLRSGGTSNDFNEFDLRTNFDVTTDNNALYKFNSVHGGVIVPRGTSLVGIDLRKTKIRPKYVPDPEDGNIERSSVFQLTGGCYIWQLSIFDADPNGQVYKNYGNQTFVPNFSHHKLTVFEYADGANNININDNNLVYSTDRTDLDIYYEKIGLAYGPASERNIAPDYPGSVDIETKVDEFRIVGSRGAEIGISSIRSGNGVTPSGTITVTLESELDGLAVDTPIRINGVTASGYNGQFVVKAVNSPTEIEYSTSNIPIVATPSPGGTLNITVDTVTSASPYVFNCSLRSVYGMCGLHADGSLVSGFKSMVVAQFTGISLQKDNNAFVKYDIDTGTYLDTTNVENIYSDSLAKYKPEYESYHIKASNNSFIQCVSIFAIGYANHFLAESGGDMSITNSNSNFGARSLLSTGFSDTKFNKDDVGYISHIIPPKHIDVKEITIEFDPIDIAKTTSVGNSTRLYLYDQKNISFPPIDIIDGYRIGAKIGDQINFIYQSGGFNLTYSASITMSGGTSAYEKSYRVAKSGSGNAISSNIITLTENHNLTNGETVRVLSNTGQLPGNVFSDRIYYAITSGLSANQLKLASSLNDAINGSSEVSIFSNENSDLKVVSRVSDKNSGDAGHPIQWDGSQWYVTVLNNGSIGSLPITDISPRTFIKRIPDTRNIEDTLYKFRYVIPKDSAKKSRPPVEGFVIQESTDLPLTSSEVDYKYSPNGTTKTLDNSNQLRNTRFIASASWSSSTATIRTEIPHRLPVGSKIEIRNVLSSNNSSGQFNSGFNGEFTVTSVLNTKEFTYALTTNPGTFVNNTSSRTVDLPYFNKKSYPNTYYIYRSNTVQEYVNNEQDGIYYLIVLSAASSPTIEPFTQLKVSQPLKSLYQQIDKDNAEEDPDSAETFALPNPIGQVALNDPQNSITKKTLDNILLDSSSGNKLTSLVSTGIAHTFTTELEHGLNPITNLSLTASIGSNYGTGSGLVEDYYNAQLVGSATGEGATAAVTINSGGQITDIEIIDGGSAYQIGDILTVVGIATTAGHVPAEVSVSAIYNHVGETVRVTGVSSESYSEYNNLYRITEISSSKTVNAESILATSANTLGTTFLSDSNLKLTGRSLRSTDSSYNSTSKKITLEDSTYATVGQKIRTIDNTNSYRDFVVTNISTSNPLELTIEPTDNNLTEFTTTNDYWVLPFDYSSQSGENFEDSENRLISQYAGISTTISSNISALSTILQISNIEQQGLKLGDYLQIEDEIVRIDRTVTGNPIRVIRGVLGTRNSSHSSGTAIKKINPLAIEFRRYSILRASGHTFEYVGFGPGNYSNSLPERQDREKTEQEDLLSQSLKLNGGINVYTGMNNDGDFYIGNKRVNPATGQEDVFDSPFQTIRGKESEILNDEPVNVIGTQDINVSKSIRVEGGTNANIVSEFNGPVIFNNKITSNSPRGIEGNSLFLQGNETISRKYTVGISTPSIPGNSGDVVFRSEPTSGGTVGWVYTSGNAWEQFGRISSGGAIGENSVNVLNDGTSVGSASGINFKSSGGLTITDSFNAISGICTLDFTADVNSPTNLSVSGFSTFSSGVQFKQDVTFDKNANITGILTAGTINASNINFTNSINGPSIGINTFTAANAKFSGNIILGTIDKTSNTFLRVLSGNNSTAGIEAFGNSQGTGYLYVGESNNNGGGIFFNGDGSPTFASNETQDEVSFYRKFEGTNTVVFSYPANSSDVTFKSGITVNGDVNSTSDERLKSNIKPINNASDILEKIDGVEFTWNETSKKSLGVIAQQVETVLPEIVDDGDHKSVNYNGLIAVLIEAVKQQQKQINDLEEKIKSLGK